MNDEHKVYVSLQDGYITSINSDIFLSQEEIQTMTEIDRGQGDRYAHAQSQYLEKELVDEKGRYNYKFVEGKVIEVAEEDKPKVVDPEQQATALDKIEAQVMYTALMTDTLLGKSEAQSMFEKIKRFYDLKLYTDKQVRKFCEKGIITADQYKKITSENY